MSILVNYINCRTGERQVAFRRIEIDNRDKSNVVPKREVAVFTVTLFFLIATYFFFFLLPYGSYVSQLSFLSLPVFFLLSASMVLASLIILVTRMRRCWIDYTHRDKTILKVLLLCILLLILSYPIAARYLPVLGVRLRIARTGGVDQLQAWAVDILAKPVEEIVAEEDRKREFWRIKKDLYSEQMLQLSPIFVILAKSDDNQACLHIPLAGGFFPGWGIMVGAPSFHMQSGGGIHVYRWKNGVYGFSL